SFSSTTISSSPGTSRTGCGPCRSGKRCASAPTATKAGARRSSVMARRNRISLGRSRLLGSLGLFALGLRRLAFGVLTTSSALERVLRRLDGLLVVDERPAGERAKILRGLGGHGGG